MLCHSSPSLRPLLSLDDYHRSSPPSPYEMDPRDPRSMNAAFDACRMGMDGLEYFGAIGMGPFANRSHSRGPYPPGYDQEIMMEQIFFAQFVNGQITCAARCGRLQPKMCADVEEVKVMDPTALDRTLRAYVLPTSLRSLQLTSCNLVSTKIVHQAKLCTLFGFLGAVLISA
ncbi:uncharacterized protein K441DRAFT_706545 [Cenococcum geophilum 1.58]|uniref:uncharacterized protein n=1 Tax=Cenococcum geophilum 1.58 TaxID=794803 RepID=UPI00358FE979|nr:hypothetical protein K441DRAFT_706545 [Cenococcum geophilum 1.58]